MLDIWELGKSWLAPWIGWELDSVVRLVVEKQAQIRSRWHDELNDRHEVR